MLVSWLSTGALAATHTVIIAGLGGEPEYEQRFAAQAQALADAAAKSHGPSQVVLLSAAEARRDAVRGEFEALAQRLSEDDTVVIVLIGHGTFDGEEYRFNLPGPDLTASELGQLFDRLPAREQLIVNATSASGAALEPWIAAAPGQGPPRQDSASGSGMATRDARPGMPRESGADDSASHAQPSGADELEPTWRARRIVIAATKSGGERTATRFAQYWVQAVTTPEADVDKNEIVTAAEAFEYTNRQVAASFKSDNVLATEHGRVAGEGAASQFIIARLGTSGGSGDSVADPQLRALLQQRGAIEHDLDLLKERRAALDEAAYYDALESVLVRLALLQRRIDASSPSSDVDGGGG